MQTADDKMTVLFIVRLVLASVLLTMAAATHFMGATIQWRPVDPVNFDGHVSLRMHIWIRFLSTVIAS